MSPNDPINPGPEYLAHLKKNFVLCVGDLAKGEVWIYSRLRKKFVGTLKHDTPGHDGYQRLNMRVGDERKTLKYHHVSFFLYYGFWPRKQLDHIDDDKENNHPLNFKEVTDLENQRKMQRRKMAIKNYFENKRAMLDHAWPEEKAI